VRRVVVRLGIGLPQVVEGGQFDVERLGAVLREAEELGFHSAWVLDQAVTRSPALDPLLVLAYAATVTDSIRLATGVLLIALRHPVALARETATLDRLSEGRLILGVGVGARGSYVPALGIPPADRGERFVECLDLLEELWTKDRVTFSGRFWELEGTEVEPKPVQRPRPPIWFGGMAGAALDRAVRRGDGWIGAGASLIEEFKERAATVRQLLEETGRDPATFGIGKRVYISVSADREPAMERMRAWSTYFYGGTEVIDRAAIVGNLDYCLTKLAQVKAAGADLILLNPVFDEVELMRLLAGAIDQI
jgi:probable F420-dependent oxidoreductase